MFLSSDLTPVSLAHDAARQRTVMFGAAAVSGSVQFQTWEYDGADWTLRQSRLAPPTSSLIWSNVVYDELRQRTLVVIATSSTTETSEWDGTTWTQVHSGWLGWSQSFRLARDPVRNIAVLLIGTYMPACWTFDGSIWALRGPGPQFPGPVAFDPVRGEVVCRFNSTMAAFDGVTWLSLVAPGPTLPTDLVTDPWLLRVLTHDWNRTWDWDGAAWRPVVRLGPAPLFSTTRGYCFDQARSGMLMFTGVAGYSTWVYRELPGSPAAFATFGSGCAGPAGTPLLAAASGSLPRLGRTLSLQIQNLGASPAVSFGVFGFDASQWQGQPLPLDLGAIGAPGCDLHLAPLRTTTLAAAAGAADWRIGVPALPSLIGVMFYVQAASWMPGSLAVSNGGQAVVGPR